MAVSFQVEYKPTPVLDRLIRRLSDAGRAELAAAGAAEAARNTQKYLRGLAASRHATAGKLGAAPTQVIGRAAAGTVAREDCVVVPHPLFKRAFGAVTIAPRTARALAIPMHRDAYGRGPRTMSGLFVWKRNRKAEGPDDKGAAFLARSVGKGKNARLELMYLLHRGRILQRQDRSLLPSDEETAAAAMKGISTRLNSIIRAVTAQKGAS